MVVKTITITKIAYDALKSLKSENESFSNTILRVAKRRPLSDFIGVLSEESAAKLERCVQESRKRHTEEHRIRVKKIVDALEGKNGGS